MKLSEIRQQFLKYFQDKQHTIVRSSPLVPGNDPSLLFTNAGMVQFKEVFLGTEKRNYTKAVSVQRCLRAGGKHNDLENVGYTARHHTFFEMMGNFSFGDYFKTQAIKLAWGFLTEVIKLPPEKLWVTVYEEDDEAADIWLKEIKVDPSRFSRCGKEDNYWSMGDTGPCGPCTEIFYDHGPDVPGGPPGSPDGDLDRYIEIWNLVFMQYDRDSEGNLTELPNQCVDTGMGIERLAAVVQGVHSNYEIDLFANLIKAAANIINTQDLENQSLRVLADHIRACSFLIADGVVPANEGRGYVLRRIIRRAIRHGNKLGANDLFFYKLVAPLCVEMGEAYPELIKAKTSIETILKQEEEQFARTLDQGLKILNQSLEQSNSESNFKLISGELAFRLYDTYGFPIDLTLDIARENNYTVDIKSFEQELNKQRDRSKQGSSFKAVVGNTAEREELIKILGKSDTEFTGYESLIEQVNIVKLLDIKSQEQSSLKEGELGFIITDRTPFYAEGGGQVGDVGRITSDDFIAEVDNTVKINKIHLHKVRITKGEVSTKNNKNNKVDAIVNITKRNATARNHSATHLLHAALRKNLGEQVNQKGSYVGPDYLRFDFSHFKPLSQEELDLIETEVNQQILKNTKTEIKLMNIDQAIASGAIALFGEKYEDDVRVLNFGGGYSVELCGGTHVSATGDIGLFIITQESSAASGIRRIEALTGDSARQYLKDRDNMVKSLSSLLRAKPNELLNKADQLQQSYSKALKEIENLKHAKLSSHGSNIADSAEEINGVKVLVTKLEGVEAKQLRAILDNLKSELQKAVILLATENNSKVNLIAGVTNNCTDRVNAVTLVNVVAEQLGGKGGGRPDMAQAGAKHPERLDDALSKVKPWLQDMLKN